MSGNEVRKTCLLILSPLLTVPSSILGKCGEAMEITQRETETLFASLAEIIRIVLFESVSTKEGLLKLLPGIASRTCLTCLTAFL